MTVFSHLSTIRSLQDVLSTFNELSDWKLKQMPTDVHSLHNALIMRVCCHNRKHCWPLLIDPDQQAQMWVQALQDSENIIREDELVQGGNRGIDEHRPLSVISDASMEFDDTRSVGVSTTISAAYTSRANTRWAQKINARCIDYIVVTCKCDWYVYDLLNCRYKNILLH